MGHCRCAALLLALAAGPALAADAPPAPAVRIAYVVPLQPQPPIAGVFFADEFDSADLRARYFEYDDGKGSFVLAPGEGYGDRGGAMRCRFERGQVSAGSLKVLFGRNPFQRGIRRDETFRELTWRVYVKHERGWEGNPAKLARATCLAGTDWSQGFIAHVWGGRGDALCIDPATGIRDSRKVSTRYNDFANLRWLGVKHGRIPIFSTAESGRWVCVEAQVRLNTPGAADGVFRLWVDGHLEAEHEHLDWHGRWDEYAVNAFFLENYWNQGSVKRQARWFDCLALGTQRIGPIVAETPPRATRTEVPLAAWEVEAAADPDGRDVVWRSRPLAGTVREVPVDAAQGAFAGSLAGKRSLPPNALFWLRVRQRNDAGAWSDWSPWHAPFATPHGT
ncbi:MAG: hypothetical protein QHJ73_04530 [Armatimonadota bacterium]|nr:hypothetical protein [Armatimonadota bacterium]